MFFRYLVILSVVVLAPATEAVSAEKTVGELGDLKRIEFIGNEAFTVDQLRFGLLRNLDVVVASRPEGDLDLWLRTLQRQIMIGYESTGYASTVVKTRFEEDRGVIVAVIEEGPRYLRGKVEIVGANTLPIEEFEHQLSMTRIVRKPRKPDDGPTAPNLPPRPMEIESPIWTPGESAAFSTEYWNRQVYSFKSIFESFGYYAVRFSVGARREADQTGTLVVKIEDEGPRSTLDFIEVTGLIKNSQDDLAKYLGLQPGMPLDSRVKERIEGDLWYSARFLDYDVQIVTGKAKNGQFRSGLKMKVREYEPAPLILEGLSDEQKSVLQFVNWLTSINEWNEDLEVTYSGPVWQSLVQREVDKDTPPKSILGAARILISPRQKAIMFNLQAGNEPDQKPLDWTLHMTPNLLNFDSVPERLRYESSGVGARLILMLDWQENRFKMGPGYGSGGAPNRAPFEVLASMPPVLALEFVDRFQLAIKIHDQVATVESNGLTVFTFDRNTGALNEFDVRAPDGHSLMKISSRAGLYQNWLQEHENSMLGGRRFTSNGRPVTSIAEFVAALLPQCKALESDIPVDDLATLLGRVLNHDGLKEFDRAILTLIQNYSSSDRFWVPDARRSELVKEHAFWHIGLVSDLDGVLPRNNVYQTIVREFVLSEVMQNYHTSQSFADLIKSQSVGPMTLQIARLARDKLGHLNSHFLHDVPAVEFSNEAFQRDCDLLLTEYWPVGRLLVAATEALQESTAREIHAISSIVTDNEDRRKTLNNILSRLPAMKETPPNEALRQTAVALWREIILPAALEANLPAPK